MTVIYYFERFHFSLIRILSKNVDLNFGRIKNNYSIANYNSYVVSTNFCADSLKS